MRTRALALLILLAAGLAGPAAARPLDEVRAAGAVRIVVYRDFPPFSREVGGRPAGIDVDIGGAIARHLGVTPEIILLSADESVDDDLRNGVWKGPRIGGSAGDLMMHVPYDRALQVRNELIVLFAPYHREELVVARRSATQVLTAAVDDRLGVEIASISDLYLSGAYGGRFRENTRRFLNLYEAAAALARGEVDGLMGPRSEVETALATVGSALVVSAPGLPNLLNASWPIGVAVKEDSRDLGYAVEDAVNAMIADGTMAEIFRKHGATHRKP